MSPLHVDRCVFRSFLLLPFLVAFSITTSQAQASDKAVDDLVTQAHKAMTTGKPQDAESILRKAIELAPTRADLYLMRSRARDSGGSRSRSRSPSPR